MHKNKNIFEKIKCVVEMRLIGVRLKRGYFGMKTR